MKRCKHKNFTVYEFADDVMAHVFIEGKYMFSEDEVGLMQNKIVVECYDCKKKWAYSQNKMPKWVEKMFDPVRKLQIPSNGIVPSYYRD